MSFKIPPLGVNPDTFTVTGASSGGCNSVKMMLTDPVLFKGAGVMISGPPIYDLSYPLADLAKGE